MGGVLLPPSIRSDLVRTNIAVVEESAKGEGGEGISEESAKGGGGEGISEGGEGGEGGDGGEGGGTAGRLRVRPYHDSTLPPHGCPHCPPNMCKGDIVDELRTTTGAGRVLYVNLSTTTNCVLIELTIYVNMPQTQCPHQSVNQLCMKSIMHEIRNM